MKKIGRDYVNVSTPLDGLFFSFLSFFLQAMCNLLGIKESKRLQWLELAMSSIKELKKKCPATSSPEVCWEGILFNARKTNPSQLKKIPNPVN